MCFFFVVAFLSKTNVKTLQLKICMCDKAYELQFMRPSANLNTEKIQKNQH